MTQADLLLAIDNGTQSLRALVFDLRGNLVAGEKVTFSPYRSPQPGWAEQDPEVFWNALCTACQRLWEDNAAARDRIAGVTLTTQRGTVINLDHNDRILRPAILWLDQRKTRGLPAVSGLWGAAFKLLRLTDTIAYFQAEAEANWIRTHQPDIWRATRKYLLLSGFLTHRLVGAYTDSVGCCVGYLPFDYRGKHWAAGWDWKWKALPMDREILPELVPPGQPLGTITRTASEATGIPRGLPLIAAAADKACEVIGSGSKAPDVGCISYGTTATINVTLDRYVEAIPMLPPYPSAVPDHYTMEVQVYRGYWMVRWFKEEFGHPEVERAARDGVEAEALFDELIENIPPGSMGLTLQPYWSPGLRRPGPEAKGAVIGFGDVHTRAHLYRAILEGLAYALREGKERIERKTRVPIRRLVVSGGGSQSRQAMQATADVFNIPTARPHLYETSGLGAAIDLAVGVGLHPDFDQAVSEMTRCAETFDPIPENVEQYEGLYRYVYRKMYPRLKPLYEKIRDITRYPG